MAEPQKIEYRTTNLPDYLDKPYQEYMGLYSGQVSEDIKAGMPAYLDAEGKPKERIAGLSEVQQMAMDDALAMQPSQQLKAATGLMGAATANALDTQYTPSNFSNQFQSPNQYNPSQFNAQNVNAPNLQNYQFQGAPRDVQARSYDAPSMQGQQTGYNPNLQSFQMDPAERVQTQSFAQPGSAEAYMSPYMQNVVDIQKREAQRQSGIQGTQQQAQAAKAGAFGGSRDAIMRAERERNLSQQMGDIQATGSQAAYQQAQQQFNQEQQARLSAQQANQQAGLTTGSQNLAANLGVQQLGTQTGLQTSLANLNNQQQAAVQNQAAQLQTQGMNAQQALQAALANQQMGYNVGQQNLAANLGVQQFGAGQNMQAQLANQQTGMTAQQSAEASRQFGAGQGLQAAGLSAQYGQAAQQLGEQSRQYGAGLGLQGQQAAMQGAGALGTLGNMQYQQNMGINQLQQGYGGMQQNLAQQRMNTEYEDFQNKQNYPYQLLNQYGNVLNRQPASMNLQQTTYGQSPSLGGQIIGTAGALATSPAGKNIFGFADGGMVQSYDEGGVADSRDVTDESYIAKLIEKLSLPQLQAILGNPAAPRMQKQLAADQIEELQYLQASAQRGLYGAAQNTPSIDQMYPAEDTAYGANGGIVAFADGDFVIDPMMGTTQSTTASDDDRTFFEKLGLGNRENRRVLEASETATRKREEAANKPPAAPAKQKETPYDPRTATRRSDYKESAPQIGAGDLKGLSSALKGLPSSYKDEVLAAAKEFSKGDEEVNAKLESLLGKDKKRSEDFKNESSRMYWNKFFAGMAQAGAEPGQSGLRGIVGTAAKSAGRMPEYESELRKEQNQYDMLLEKNEVDNLKYKVALKDRNFDRAANLQKAIKDNQFQMQQLQQQAADSASRIQLSREQLAQTGKYQQGMLDMYGKRADAMVGANKVRMAGMEAKVMPMFQNDPNTRKLAKQLEDQYGKNWQSQPGPQAEYYRSYEIFKARTMPSLVAESESNIPYSSDY
jgi:hypothetical protein